jgi:lysophospholipid acyltransferase (LPLAT)-like uncharacterized protein
VKPGRLSLLLAPFLASGLIRLVHATMRIRRRGHEAMDRLAAAGRPFIIAFWHDQLFLMQYAYTGPRRAMLISRHGDGEFIARTMERFGLDSVRGSSTRGGAAALREVARKLRAGGVVGITPDGPRGPRHRLQPGVVYAARLAHAPIVPVAFGVSKKNF